MSALVLPRRIEALIMNRISTLKPNLKLSILGSETPIDNNEKIKEIGAKPWVKSTSPSREELFSILLSSPSSQSYRESETNSTSLNRKGSNTSKMKRSQDIEESTSFIIPKTYFGDFPPNIEGIIPFRGKEATISGHLLIDKSLSQPVQVIDLTGKDIDEAYVRTQVENSLNLALRLAEIGKLDIGPTAAFRLIHNVNAGLPGINVDVYGEYAMIHLYSSHWDQYLHTLANALVKNTLRPLQGVYLTNHIRRDEDVAPYYTSRIFRLDASRDSSRRSKSVCIAGQKTINHSVQVEENGVKYLVRLDNGAATGLYLDQRENRAKIADLITKIPKSNVSPEANFAVTLEKQPKMVELKVKAPKKHGPMLLNPFAFTCAFSLAAAVRSPSVSTLNIDLSKNNLRWGQDNFALNRIDTRGSMMNVFWTKEVFRGIYSLMKTGKMFDMVVLDPPTVSRINLHDRSGLPSNLDKSKSLAEVLNDPHLNRKEAKLADDELKTTKSDRESSRFKRRSRSSESFTFVTSENYSKLGAIAAALVAPGGYLIAFTNTQGLARSAFLDQVQLGFETLRKRKANEIAEGKLIGMRRSLRFKGYSKKKTSSRMAKKLKVNRLTSLGADTEVVKRFLPSDAEVKMIFDFELVEELFPSIEFRSREYQNRILGNLHSPSLASTDQQSTLTEDEELNRQLMGYVWRRKFVDDKVVRAVMRGEFDSLNASDKADVLDVSETTEGKSKRKSSSNTPIIEKVVSFRKGRITTKGNTKPEE